MPENERFDPERLGRISAPYVVSPPLLDWYGEDGHQNEACSVIIELNLDHRGGASGARDEVEALLGSIAPAAPRKPYGSRNHVFARLTLAEVIELVETDGTTREGVVDRAIHKIWRDRPLQPFMDRSTRIVKADACYKTFNATGEGIVWAVADSGIDGSHPHFQRHANLDLENPNPHARGTPPDDQGRRLAHRDFTGGEAPLTDVYGHGTHVAGIVAGTSEADPSAARRTLRKLVRRRDADGTVLVHDEPLEVTLQSMAPQCKLLSLKVLDDKGSGEESGLIAALDYVAEINGDGDKLRIHGVNLSLGYPFDAEWYAAGQSPLCVAVDRLVESRVIVVAAAGNEGSGFVRVDGSAAMQRVGIDQSIADPGNAARAITVGSTHPVSPEAYGISYFSSRGPTADGRHKPDLVAPGERILSCASSGWVGAPPDDLVFSGPFKSQPDTAYYREESGTSMAAPHVSGAIAAMLSRRTDMIGKPERVKKILCRSCTDLKRRRDFQGAGLLDLFRALQSF